MLNSQTLLWAAAMAVAAGLMITAAGGRRRSLIEVLRSFAESKSPSRTPDSDADQTSDSD